MQTSPISPLHRSSWSPADRLDQAAATQRRKNAERSATETSAAELTGTTDELTLSAAAEDSVVQTSPSPTGTAYPRPNAPSEPPPLHDRFSDLERRASAMTPTLLSIMVRARYEPYTHGGINE